MRKKDLRGALRVRIKTLILQEVRLLRLEQGFTPHMIIGEMSQSIQETKKEITKLTKTMA